MHAHSYIFWEVLVQNDNKRKHLKYVPKSD